MFYIVFDFMMAVIMFLFGMWFYKSEGKATKFLSGYNMKSADERKKYDENAMCKAYGKRMMFMSVPFIIGIIIDIQYQGIGCWIFVGGLIMSLAEVLDVFPILLRRGRIQSGIPWMVLSIGIGKMLGAYLYFSNL